MKFGRRRTKDLSPFEVVLRLRSEHGLGADEARELLVDDLQSWEGAASKMPRRFFTPILEDAGIGRGPLDEFARKEAVAQVRHASVGQVLGYLEHRAKMLAKE